MKSKYLVNIMLFLLTFITTTISGMEWVTGTMGPYELRALTLGLPYSLSILFVLGSHEFGHYFASRYHKVEATLPYFIPLPAIAGFINFGTMGAVIKTKSRVPNNKAMFDIGVAGPLAGFAACLAVLIYGFQNLPGIDYILRIHPDYFSPAYGKNAIGLEFGDSLLFASIRYLFADQAQFIPPMSEIYHYPYLCVGWFGLFVTMLNMVPVGQLDGGHIVYSMFGEQKHYLIARIVFAIITLLGLLGIISAWLNMNFGWTGWLFWGLILLWVIKLKHPPVLEFAPLDIKRKIVGCFSLLIFVLSFIPNPISISINM